MVKLYKSPITYRLREIPVKQIKVWKDAQVRKLDREGITELARSIKNEGLQNPPMVQKDGKNSYLLMSGQRRLAELKRIGAKKYLFCYSLIPQSMISMMQRQHQ